MWDGVAAGAIVEHDCLGLIAIYIYTCYMTSFTLWLFNIAMEAMAHLW